MSDPFVPSPQAAFRVGVTGARALPAEAAALDGIRAGVAGVLGAVRDLVLDCAASPGAVEVYRPGKPLLRLLSPLAEGADRLVAHAALALGYQLEVPMPFPQGAYEDDFPETRDEFRALLAQAGPDKLEIDGRHGEEIGNRSYEAVGRLVARNCDLLIAIWDGGPGKGRGGTADIVRFAARANQPIWWLRADGAGGPCWIDSLQQLRRPLACTPETAQARLAAYVKNLILPPAGPTGPVTPPLRQFLAEAPLPKRAIWRTYGGVIRLVAGARRPPPSQPMPFTPGGEVWPYWERFYQPPDRLSVDYGTRYRSSYVLVFGLAALALWASVLGSGFSAWALAASGAELVMLVLIAILVLRNVEGRWHEKLITYRLLGELFRKQQALALLGWTVPAAEATHISGDVDELGVLPPDITVRDVWVGWYFNAVVRAAPLPRGALGGAALAEAWQAIGGSLVAGQVEYHDQRRRESRAAAERFGRLGRLFFWGTFAMVALKLPLIGIHLLRPKALGGATGSAVDLVRLFQGLLPGLSAGFVGIRGYAELELVADQSGQMQRTMSNAGAMLRNLDLTAPLASQELGAVTLSLADAMLRDIKGWAQLFRIKVVEPGG